MTARDTVLDVIERVTSWRRVRDDVLLASLGDSLAIVEVAVVIEDKLGVVLGDDAHTLATVGDLVRRVEERMGAKR